jgi:uncharacterized protein (TIGR02145 family)
MATIKRFLLFVLCVAVMCIWSCKSKESTTGEIHGIVTDAESSQPISDASIVLNLSEDTLKTASDGTFLIKDLHSGIYAIQTLKSGYMKKISNITVSPDKTSEASITLPEAPDISGTFLDFGAESTTQNFTISKKGKSVLTYTLSANQGWIEVSPASGVLTDNTQIIKVTISKPISMDIMKGEIVITSTVGQDAQEDKINVLVNGVLDQDLTYYKVVKIGGQYWMAENSHAGITVSSGSEQNDPATIKKYSYNSEYGGLYTFSGMMRGAAADNKSIGTTQGICPVGWHIPTQDEWTDLIDYLSEPVSGVKLKEAGETHWLKGNIATNESGFTALPGGMWDGYVFQLLHSHALFWTASSDQSAHYYAIQFEYNAEKGRFLPFQTKEAFSVRCVKNP